MSGRQEIARRFSGDHRPSLARCAVWKTPQLVGESHVSHAQRYCYMLIICKQTGSTGRWLFLCDRIDMFIYLENTCLIILLYSLIAEFFLYVKFK